MSTKGPLRAQGLLNPIVFIGRDHQSNYFRLQLGQCSNRTAYLVGLFLWVELCIYYLLPAATGISIEAKLLAIQISEWNSTAV